MVTASRKSASRAHWPKDYMEHLRTIHFSLIIVVIGGIIIGRTPNVRELQIAQNQLRQITEFAKKPISQWVEESNKDIPHFTEVAWFTFSWRTKQYAGTLPANLDILKFDKNVCGHDFDSVTTRTFEPTFSRERSTLDDFAKIWNEIGCSEELVYSIYQANKFLLEDFYPEVSEETIIHADVTERVNADVTIGSGVLSDLPPLKLSPKKRSKITLAIYGTDVLRRRRLAVNFNPELIFDIPFPPKDSRFDFNIDLFPSPWTPDIGLPEDFDLSILSSGPSVILFKPESPFAVFVKKQGGFVSSPLSLPVAATLNTSRPGHELLTFAQSDWQCKGRFAECFPVLNRVSAGKRTYTLKDLSEWLDEQVSHNSPRQLEIFGLKFPEEDQSRWGILLILFLLLYFWIHVNEGLRIECNEPVPNIAWVGLYLSPHSYLVVWLSVLAGPLVVISLFGLNGVHYQGPLLAFAKSNWRSLVSWVLIPCAICCSLAVSSCLKVRRLALLALEHGRSDSGEVLVN